jgi:hypothetical protein
MAMAKTVKRTMPTGICCSLTKTRRPPAPPWIDEGVRSQTVPMARANGTTKIQTK